MQANKLDGCPSNLLLTLLICLQYSDNDTGGGDVSRDVLHEPGGNFDLISIVFSRFSAGMRSVIKTLLEAMNV